jgi:predicted lactoylglutathione lyase
MLEPNAIVLYVDNLTISSNFYLDLLGINPEELSPAFHRFTLSNGMVLGLKVKHTVEPPADEKGSGGELAFTLDNNGKIDELFSEWQTKEINIAQSPTIMAYGYTFLALDPDGHRLRVVSLGKS